ncbi:MAG: SPOR domain-containing protein, partial [Thermoanaerobaculia bacterium]
RAGQPADVNPYIELGVRQTFDGLPSIGGGHGTISGVVFPDEDLVGRDDGTGIVAEVELDRTRKQQTKADGTFVFTGVARGSHQVVARVPGRPEAYFTTPSKVEVEAGERVAFGVAITPARLHGRVQSDAGDGIADVRLILTRGTQQLTAITDSSGAFSFAAAPGEWQLAIAPDSVPSGYSLAGTDARAIALNRAMPQQTSFALRAHRSISGIGAPANAILEVRPLAKTIRADEQGRFSLRSLAPGELTVVANGFEHRVVVPREPGTIALDLTSTKVPTPEIRTIARGEVRATMTGYVVNIGAFRVRANAVSAAGKAQRAGVAARIIDSGSLALVRTAPFETREAAEAAAERLTNAGLEAVVTSNR